MYWPGNTTWCSSVTDATPSGSVTRAETTTGTPGRGCNGTWATCRIAGGALVARERLARPGVGPTPVWAPRRMKRPSKKASELLPRFALATCTARTLPVARSSPGRMTRGTGVKLLFSRVTVEVPLKGTSFTSMPSRCSNSPLSHTFNPSS